MSSSTTHPYLPGTDRVTDHQQLFFQQHNQHGNNLYHVPQHSRREKLRYPHEETSLPVASLYSPVFLTQHNQGVLPEALPLPYNPMITSQGGFSLSLSPSSSNSQRRQVGSAVPGPYGPFTGYAAVLGRSRFLGPARMLLEEICDVGRRDIAQEMDIGIGDGLLDLDPSERESLSAVDRGMDSSREGSEFHWKKTRLLSLMEEVCKRYKQYYQQIQAVITSFESVAGLSNAAPFASVALKSMSKHFKCLKSMILNQLRNANKMNGKETLNREDMPSFGLLSGGGSGGSQRGHNMSGFGQPHIWRPQRGLPERAVAVLRAWLFDHFLHPYPTDTDKQMLAKQTGLTRNQVSNWFINARVRLWKPMVEEIHNLEMCQLRRHSSNDKNPNLNPTGIPQTQQLSECSGSNPSDLVQGQSSHTNHKSPNPNTTSRSIQAVELSQMPNSIQEPINFSYSSLGAGIGFSAGSSNPSGVSLTLGLQQNNRVCLTETIPANLVHRFGLEDCNDPYVMGSFEAQGRHFGKDVGGHHLLHDFVG
ncbi:hypothetical protein LUZ61_007058 [Rhynchospora tenuis]|uniref:Homeobox domain-containing protein n=1 Tax=Rhynchospora tenuis TaxID=198213 RepID=A0AAD5ZSV7_9POAL|nr:hypothetical protein LUZ61_007058 [Rhynchospora tenuis]